MVYVQTVSNVTWVLNLELKRHALQANIVKMASPQFPVPTVHTRILSEMSKKQTAFLVKLVLFVKLILYRSNVKMEFIALALNKKIVEKVMSASEYPTLLVQLFQSGCSNKI
jgi:hypothetical protein